MVIIYFSHIFHVVDEFIKQGIVVLSPLNGLGLKWLDASDMFLLLDWVH